MTGRVAKTVGAVLIGAAIFVGLKAFLYFPSGNSDKQRLIAELRQFEQYAAHERLLLDAIEATHEQTVRDNLRRQRPWRSTMRVVDWPGYRAQMYLHLCAVLRVAGDEEAAISLDRFRAGH